MASSSASNLTVADEDVLECGVCYLPLKPPIFQCTRGHVVCSPCSDKRRDDAVAGSNCHVCDIAMPGGFQRCHAMERVVESVHTPCPNARYGCEARPVYHALQDHVLSSCAHAPCHCPAGEPACGFEGSLPELLEHVVGSAHGWPCTRTGRTARDGAPSSIVHLRVGNNFFVSDNVDEVGRKYLYLFKVVRHAFCRAVSVIRICPRVPAPKAVKLVLSYLGHLNKAPKKRKGNNETQTLVSDQLFSHDQKTEFQVACSDLSDGLPDPDKMIYQLIVSKCALREDEENMTVVVKQIFPSS